MSISASLKLCLKECITPYSVYCFSHLFKAADAELPLHLVALEYEGNRNWVQNPCWCLTFTASRDTPTSGTNRLPPKVLAVSMDAQPDWYVGACDQAGHRSIQALMLLTGAYLYQIQGLSIAFSHQPLPSMSFVSEWSRVWVLAFASLIPFWEGKY